MAQKRRKHDTIDNENNLNFRNTNSNKLSRRSSNDLIRRIDNNLEINPTVKRQKFNVNIKSIGNGKVNGIENPSQSQRCNFCHQRLDDLKFYEDDNFKDAVFEDVALTDDRLHLSIDGDIIDDNLSPTYKMIDFCVYDNDRHLCRFDTGLIEDNVHLYCSGYIVPIYDENPKSQSGVATTNIGPINEWYTTGFDGGEKVLVCISTQFAEYYLVTPSEQYKSFMSPIYEKAYMSKLVIEFITSKDDPTYEDLIDELQMMKPPPGMPQLTEESLLNNVEFICDQITSLDINSENPNDFHLLTTSCMRSLINLTGVTVGKKMKACKPHEKSPVKKRKQSWTTPAMTNLVQEVFHKFYPQTQENNTTNSKSEACGVCEACRKSDCGACYVCKKMKKTKNCRSNNKLCIKRRCPNKAIQDANDASETDENDVPTAIQSRVEIPRYRETKLTKKDFQWIGNSNREANGRIYYKCAQVGSTKIIPGDFIFVDVINPASEQIARVIDMWEEYDGTKMIHVNWYLRGRDSILGNIADHQELFALDECSDLSLNCIKRQCIATRLKTTRYSTPLNSIHESGILNEAKRRPCNKFFYQKRYIRDSARFEDLIIPKENINHSLSCPACIKTVETQKTLQPSAGEKIAQSIGNRIFYGVVTYRNEEYRLGDGVYISPSTAFINEKLTTPVPRKLNRDDIDEDLYPEYYRKYFTGDHVKGSNYDTPEPFDVGYIRAIFTKTDDNGDKPVTSEELFVEFNRMYRSEDTHEGASLVQTDDINTLYWSDEIYEVPFSKIMGRCLLSYFASPESVTEDWMRPHRFYFTQTYDVEKKLFHSPPSTVIEAITDYNNNRKDTDSETEQKRPLKTLDIFAGCGGLSAGLIKAGAADVRWAIERDRAAARAFQVNHPEAVMYQGDCNSLLEDIMSGKQLKDFPKRGDVELLCGGPPCQGFSGLNRFNSTQYAYLKNTLLFTFLSFCDYYRPKFVVMENVLNFTLHNKGMMLKIALYCFLRMGYQCTVAILQAGNFGLPQSRRRTILLASAPGETLPKYPEPLHVFSKRACQREVVIDGKKYLSDFLWEHSAPYRTICVRDAISDLPNIENGNSDQRVIYKSDAITYFQKKMRSSSSQSQYVWDHICKKMSPLVLARMENIPKVAGADWRDLPNIVVQLSDGTFTKKLEYRYVDKKAGKHNSNKLRGVCACASGKVCNPLDRQENTLIPWCLPHTANRQYGWAGTYGRLDWNGFFGTTVTNPEPLGKQGRVLHPEQSRVVSVRECARSQGFPDSYSFEGTLIEKYRQIGNAVPPPLAEAIGHEIKRVIQT